MASWIGVWDEGDQPAPAPPGSGPTQTFNGPWFSTQLILSLSIGITSFLLFCLLRTRWEVVYMGRTKLKDFSPTPAHWPDAQNPSSPTRFFGWILPTIRTSEFIVLQTVGLDAAVLLSFFRMAFVLFSLCALLATVVLMPINFFRWGSTDAPDEPPANSTTIFTPQWAVFNSTAPPTFYDVLVDPQTSATLHLVFAYIFTGLTLTFLHRNFHRFVLSRQSFALQLIHSVSSRTVIVTDVPQHLRGDRALAEYFEACGWDVESVSVCRSVGPVKRALEIRTEALLKLERAWVDWVGNPAKAEGYDPGIYRKKAETNQEPEPLIPGFTATTPGDGDVNGGRDGGAVARDPEALRQTYSYSIVQTDRPRPSFRRHWFGAKIDAIEHWESKFHDADEELKNLRKRGRFEATHVAFVTFEDVKDAQASCQVAHYPEHSQAVTRLAPEPRDVLWSKVSMSRREAQIRDVIVMGVMTVLLLFWAAPVSSLATLLSYKEIKHIAPWLAKLIKKSPRLGAIVQNTLPSLALIAFNGFLPFFLEWLSYEQGFKSRSATEYALTRKYYLFLLISVLFIFLLTSTYWALALDLADTPMKIPEKLANALQGSNARNFMISYVMLQALGLMPMQLLNIGPLFTIGWGRLFAKTPRDYAEANAPPMLNYGWVYPPSMLIFTITLVYSVVSPLILVFGALYFGMAYLVFKYKLLFIYFKPYESNGEAWRITFDRLQWALVIFQLFMTGLFSLRKSLLLVAFMIPLIMYTLWWSYTMSRDFGPLSDYLALSSVCEVQRGEAADEVLGVRSEGVTRSQSNLNHRRYAINDDTLYVAPSDRRTDYSQPPMSNFYLGVLNTGRRRYAHPALTGSLPQPWLPAKDRPTVFGDGAALRRGVVLSLRRKIAKRLRRNNGGDDEDAEEDRDRENRSRSGSIGGDSATPDDWGTASWARGVDTPTRAQTGGGGASGTTSSSMSNPWRDPTPPPSDLAAAARRLSFGVGPGVIALPEGNVWDDYDAEAEGGDEPASPSTYYHRPNRRRTLSGSEAGLGAAVSVGAGAGMAIGTGMGGGIGMGS